MTTHDQDNSSNHPVDTNDCSDSPDNPIAAVIDTAEVFPGLLDDLVERTTKDPDAIFDYDVLQEIAALKTDDPAAYHALRARLKKVNCQVKNLDKAIDGITGGSKPLSQLDRLIELTADFGLFHSPDKVAFADIFKDGHCETIPVDSPEFRNLLIHAYYAATGSVPKNDALKSAQDLLRAKALYDWPEREIYIRVGGIDDKIYLDLCNYDHEAVEIDENGWRKIGIPPIRFKRTAGMEALPLPVSGGSIDTLRQFLNIKAESDFVVIAGWLLAALWDTGPYSLLVFSGEPGSAKSTTCAILRALIDPNKTALRAMPRNERNLFISASKSHVLTFDNASTINSAISNALCIIATGGSSKACGHSS